MNNEFNYVTAEESKNYITLRPGEMYKASAFTRIPNEDGWDYVYYLAHPTNSEYVYVMTNDSIPNQVKIGMTRGTPEQRAKQLSTTGVPTPWKVEYAFECFHSDSLESELHHYFAAQRVADNREMFYVTVEKAKQVIEVLGQRYSISNFKTELND